MNSHRKAFESKLDSKFEYFNKESQEKLTLILQHLGVSELVVSPKKKPIPIINNKNTLQQRQMHRQSSSTLPIFLIIKSKPKDTRDRSRSRNEVKFETPKSDILPPITQQQYQFVNNTSDNIEYFSEFQKHPV